MNIIKCYCGACVNNTCEITKNQGLCYAGVKRNKFERVETKFYCLAKPVGIMQKLVCSDTTSSLGRCCDSSDFCNNGTKLLPPQDEIDEWFSKRPPPPRMNATPRTNFHRSITGNQQPQQSLALSTDIPQSTLSPAASIVNNPPTSLNTSILIFVFLPFLLILLMIASTHLFISLKRLIFDTSQSSIDSAQSPDNFDRNIRCRNGRRNSNSDPISNYSHDYVPFPSDNTASSGLSGQNSMSPSTRKGETEDVTEVIYLSPRSVAYDIEIVNQIGKGRFGTVWQATYKGRSVAVKIFSIEGKVVWNREKDIYVTSLLRHRNILGFIASDQRPDHVTHPGYWLVTDYYALGSLRDYLRFNTLEPLTTLRMAYSIINGLDHLHTEILGTQGKPAIVHRDIKSTNILVKSDKTCCIADLGLATRYNASEALIENQSYTRVGTCRYLAPEILANKVDQSRDFETLKASDVYSFALVLWEMLRRTRTKINRKRTPEEPDLVDQEYEEYKEFFEEYMPRAPKYSKYSGGVTYMGQDNETTSFLPTETIVIKPEPNFNSKFGLFWYDHLIRKDCTGYELVDPYYVPYQEFIRREPTLEEMEQIVLHDKIRPPISYRWIWTDTVRKCARILCECWYDKPEARLTALHIRRRLGEISDFHYKLDLDLN